MEGVIEQGWFFSLFVILITSHLSGLNAINHSLSQNTIFNVKSAILLHPGTR